MKTPIHALGVLAALAVLAGCRTFSQSCDAPPRHGSDETVPALRVPAGLETPDTRNALNIPDLNEPERPRGKSDRCLEEPPAYAPGLNLDRKPPQGEKADQSEKTGKAAEKP